MNDLLLLLPEIIMTVFAFGIITLDIAWKDDAKSAKIIPWITFGGAMLTLLAIMYIWPAASTEYGIATDANNQVTMLAIDPMALFFKLIAVLTIILVSVSAVEYVNHHTPFRAEFYALTMFAGLSLMFLSSAVNLIMIYLALEFLSITSYILTGFLRRDRRSTEAAMKYFLYGALASGIMLYGFSLLYGATGSVELSTIAVALSDISVESTFLVIVSVMFILAGFGFKIALVPFHQWSPDAYEGAPTPITAFLSVGPKAAGFAVLIRVLVVALPEYSLSWTVMLSVIAILTMTVGNLVALWQTNIKRMLAYSSIAQAGYMLIGLAAWSANPSNYSLSGGVTAILIFIFAYLFTNLGVFAVAIIIENKTGTANITDYAGLVRRSPFLSFALLVFFLSLIGIPPTGGFIGKMFVFGAAVDQSLFVLAAFGVVNSAISVYYYFGVSRQVFFNTGDDESPIKAGFGLNAVVMVTLSMTLLIALYAQPFIEFATESAGMLTANF